MSRPAIQSSASEQLPYRIELWNEGSRDEVERVLARALGAQLAHAIFQAARSEHPNRRITLSMGEDILADSAENPST